MASSLNVVGSYNTLIPSDTEVANIIVALTQFLYGGTTYDAAKGIAGAINSKVNADGANLTNLSIQGKHIYVQSSAPSSPAAGDVWIPTF